MNESDFSADFVTILLCLFFRAGVISLTSNIVVLLMFWKFKELRTATNFIIINLAFTDIGVASIGYPMSAASDIHGSWKFGHTGCQVSGKTLQRFVIIVSHAHAGFLWAKGQKSSGQTRHCTHAISECVVSGWCSWLECKEVSPEKPYFNSIFKT